MLKINLYLAVLIILTNYSLSQFIQNSSRSIFSDVKAFQAGDAIMILIMEDTQANNSADTKSSRDTELSGSFGYNAGSGGSNYGGKLGTGTKHQGSGSTNRNEKIRARLSAKIIEVVDNGNLKIEGKRTTKINGETQTITIQGIIRPVDVRPDNSVFSYNILDLNLIIEGNGSVSEIQEPGLLTKFLRILF
jgi:flagellar L-ring protein precursor FlgH